LPNNLQQRLETAVQKSEYSQGKKLKVVTKVNPEILGGLIVEIGERTIDMSVAAKISKMNKMLTDAV
jgi:F-type H+-transporting ATPase subunit O